MRNALPLIILAALAAPLARAEDGPKPAADAPKIVDPNKPADAAKPADATKPADGKDAGRTTKQDVSYQVGIQMGESVKNYKLDPEEVQRGIRESVAGTARGMDQAQFRQAMEKYQSELGAAQLDDNKKWLAENAKKPGVKTTPSGLQYEVMTAGTGKTPAATDTVSVNYKGMLPNGTVFDASANHGGPATFPLNGVIKGWTEALQLMKEGDKFRLVLPPEIAYGAQGAPPAIPPNQVLIFEVELMKVLPPQPQGPGQ